jgi:hypothetical protein
VGVNPREVAHWMILYYTMQSIQSHIGKDKKGNFTLRERTYLGTAACNIFFARIGLLTEMTMIMGRAWF